MSVLSNHFTNEQSLHVVAIKGDIDAVRSLLKLNICPNTLNTSDWSSLMVAALEGHEVVVQELITAKADVNIKDQRNTSAICLSVQQGHYKILKLLLESKATFSSTEELYSLISVAISINNVQIVNELLNLGHLYSKFNINELVASGMTFLHLACNTKNTDMVSLLITAKADVNQPNLANITPLMLTMMNGSPEILSLLIRERADVNLSGNNGLTALSIAAERGHTSSVNILLTCGADIHHRTTQGWTPLMYAVLNNHLPTAMLLISLGAHILAMPLQRVGPFDLAREMQLTSMVQLMMATFPSSSEALALSTNLFSSYMEAHPISYMLPNPPQGLFPMQVQSLVNLPRQDNISSELGVNGSHVHFDASNSSVLPMRENVMKSTSRRMLSRHDSFVAMDQSVATQSCSVPLNYPPLSMSILTSPTLHAELPCLDRILAPCELQMGAVQVTSDAVKVDNQNTAGLSDTDGTSNHVDTHINMGSVSAVPKPSLKRVLSTESNYEMSYFEAIDTTNLNALRVLHSTNADINEANRDGLTPLMYACVLGSSQFVNVLLSMKCDLNAQDRSGMSALMHATFHRHDYIVYSLVAAGASINSTCHKGDSAMSIAKIQNNTALMSFFNQHLLRPQPLDSISFLRNMSTNSHSSSSSSSSRCLFRHVDAEVDPISKEGTVINYMLQSRGFENQSDLPQPQLRSWDSSYSVSVPLTLPSMDSEVVSRTQPTQTYSGIDSSQSKPLSVILCSSSDSNMRPIISESHLLPLTSEYQPSFATAGQNSFPKSLALKPVVRQDDQLLACPSIVCGLVLDETQPPCSEETTSVMQTSELVADTASTTNMLDDNADELLHRAKRKCLRSDI